uniref:Interferon-induced very large GTPase 1-like n=1 Tax=Geotrypetes seraphini TaxID=260995 RepID=A0A6P8QFZ8_GEOSA|nr:interferon-induced very large GTPase 1-like [Geotrypetes seraphini]XP_033794755.1 interferon-induced very large GTPase 1-like [Geotrypetes seraphini]
MSGEEDASEDQVLEDPGKSELLQRLNDVGLDRNYWLPKLQDRFGINNAQALKHLNHEDYLKLECCIRHSWEKRALQELLHIPDRKATQKQLRKQRCDLLKEKKEQATKTLKELKEMQCEGKSRHDGCVKRKEEELKLAMEIPTEYWVPSEKSFSEMIENLHKQLDVMQDSLRQGGNISDRDILAHASGGQALEGIYKTSQLEDWLQKREQLVNIPDDFSLYGPDQGSVFQQKEFSSFVAESTFKKSMEKLGHSFSCSAKGGFWGVHFETSSEHSKSSESENKQKSHTEQTYICTTKYNYIPLASCFFPKDKLSLSRAVLKELQDLENILSFIKETDKENMLPRYEKFFKRFGSHANQGPLHFGGIFWWNASSEGFKTEHIEEVKKLVSEALNYHIGASYSGFAGGIGGSQSQSQASFQGTQKETFQKQIQLYITKTGGPAEADSLFQWKFGLITSNKTWCVIDRGFQLVPVWDLILSNHRKDFKDVQKVCAGLIDAYKTLTNQNAMILFGEQFISAEDDAKSFLQDLVNWKTSGTKEHLKELIDFKQKLIEKTRNYSVWINICLSDKVLQDFLSSVMKEHRINPGSDTIFIKSQIHSLIEPHGYSVKNFPNISFLMQWIYHSEIEQFQNISISEFDQFTEVLQRAKNIIQEVTFEHNTSAEAIHEAKVKSTLNLNLSLDSLLKTLRETKQTDTELLLLCIASSCGYSLEDNIFQYHLGCPEINFMLKEMKDAYKEYISLRKQNVYRAEAFLLLTGLTVTKEDKEVSPEQKRKRLNIMKKYLESHLSSEVTSVLKKYDDYVNWKALEKDLHFLIFENYETIKDDTKQRALKELENVCQKNHHQNVSKSKDELSECKMLETYANQNFLNLIKRLDLSKYYPKKMRTADFHIIDQLSLCERQPCAESELPFYYLQKLLMLDYRARYLVYKGVNEEEQAVDNPCNTLENMNKFSDVDEFFNDINEETHKLEGTCQTPIHPMDIQMAVFLCADNFMRQNLTIKLSLCQFALPLLIPNPCTSEIEFPLWSFRQVKKRWQHKTKTKEDAVTNRCEEKSICETQTPLVSFIRFGDSVLSKSQILNSLLSKQKHDVFYNRHSRGSSKECLLMKGVVEIAWYCPSGKDDDSFDDCIAFTNLRGDAREHEPQLQFLQEIASVNVILLSKSDRNEKGEQILRSLLKSSKPLICLCADKEKIPVCKSRSQVQIGIKNRNEADLINELTMIIKHMLAMLNTDSTFSLDGCVNIACKYAFIIDENDEDCKEGKNIAGELLSLLKKKKLSQVKRHFLPLQGELWHKWCKKDKELTRLREKGNKSIEQYRSDIESEKRAIRNDQLKKAFPLNNLMRSLLGILNSQTDEVKMYFLHWFKMFIDELSHDYLSKLYDEYNVVWSNMKQEGKHNNDMVNKMRERLNFLSSEINYSTFGLEHLLRELGQIYEALDMICNKDENIFALPKIAADLMISGHPIELMDGDTAHVPLKWVGDILDKLIEKLGDKRVFVLSVLGIQSTGKSTLLNAMFGLQFAVSAGRCTRGAFMQLIKVDEKLCQEMNFDFVLVIDTEGLRTLELANKATLNHDNEFATFVIGIGNMTLINIFGEIPAEMQDILQIAVQAFLRMKQVKLSPSCLFVHQNVGEITAKEKNMEGRRRLQEKLDEMTKTVAEQELCDVTCFSDVIRFDVNNHIHYFAHIWEGDPPMAPPNPSYSKNVQDLKNVILASAKNEFRHSILKMSELKHRIQDFWNALLNENFVFSFRNTLEIAAYSKLEEEYSNWTWKLRYHVLDLQTRLNNRIKNNDIDDVNNILLEKQVQEQYEAIMKDQEKYFTESKDCEILIQWKTNIENRLKELKQELIEKTKRKCQEIIELKKSKMKLDENKSKYEDELFRRSKQLALQLKGKELSEEEMRENFDTMWKNWIIQVINNSAPVEEPQIDKDIVQAILDHFKSENYNDKMESIDNSKKQNAFYFDRSKHIAMKKSSIFFFTSISFEKCDSENIQQLTSHIKQIVNEYIQKKEEVGMDYNQSYIYEIIKRIDVEVESASKGPRFTYRNKFKIDLSLYCLRKAAKRFTKLHEDFQRTNDPVAYLKSKRGDYFNSFRISCKGATFITMFPDFLCDKLRRPLHQRIYQKTAIDIAGEMKSNKQAFNGNRLKLESYILMYLAEEENFSKYMKYIERPQESFKEYIKKCVKEYFSSENSLTNFLTISLDSVQNLLLTSINYATTVVKDRKGDSSLWLDTLCKKIGDQLDIRRRDFKSLEHQDLTNIDFLKDAMTMALGNMVNSLKQEFGEVTVETFEMKPHELLLDQLAGCWEKCPFCSAICTNTISGHDGDHSVPFHRPECLTGMKWYKTNHFSVDFCTSSVASDCYFVLSEDNKIPYKNYRNAGPPYSQWSILPDSSSQLYWKWFVSKFRTNLEEHYNKKFEDKGSIPSQWNSITKEEIILELKQQI